MEMPLELTFTNMDGSDALKTLVQEKAARLDRIFDHITSCHVYIKALQKRHIKGNLYGAHIGLRVPGSELFVNSGKDDEPSHEHVEVAIRDAFRMMERRLEAWKQKATNDVKTHEGPRQGKIAEINHDEGYGQIIATDNRLIYFHKNSVVGGSFDDLQQRDTVELVVQSDESEIGPQASTVRPISAMKFEPG